MARPLKCREIHGDLKVNCFKPQAIPLNLLEKVILTIDEIEAIRLADLEGIYQEDAARTMNISRQTFGNILGSAHRKIADFLIHAKALRIEGGEVKMIERHFICYDCKKEWGVPYGTVRPHECPECKGLNIHRSTEERGFGRGGPQSSNGCRCRRGWPREIGESRIKEE